MTLDDMERRIQQHEEITQALSAEVAAFKHYKQAYLLCRRAVVEECQAKLWKFYEEYREERRGNPSLSIEAAAALDSLKEPCAEKQ